MEATLTGSATATPRRTILLVLVLVVASLACAPWSWVVDGPTPSWVVYPIVLLVGLWRMRRGGATLYFTIAAAVFFLVHLPWAWTTFTGERTRFVPDDLAVHRFEWAVSLFAVPLLTALAGFMAWREARKGRDRPNRSSGGRKHGEGPPQGATLAKEAPMNLRTEGERR